MPQGTQPKNPQQPHTCQLAGAGTLFKGAGIFAGLSAFGGAVVGAGVGLAELPEAIAAATQLGGLYGVIGVDGAISNVAGLAVVGAVTVGAASVVVGIVAVGGGVYSFSSVQGPSRLPRSSYRESYC